MGKTSVKNCVTAALVSSVLFLSGCAGWWNSERDAIRRAVVAHELDEQAQEVDDIIVRLSPGEFRGDFGHGSRIVWLVSTAYDRQYREAEYFRVRDRKRSYLFIQDVSLLPSQNRATVGVVVSSGSGKPIAKEISLRKRNDSWEVTSARVLDRGPSGMRAHRLHEHWWLNSSAGLPEWGAEAVDAAILDMGGERGVRGKVVSGDSLPDWVVGTAARWRKES